MSAAPQQLLWEPEPLLGPDLASYDRFLVMTSAGKDSLATLLRLLDAGVPKERIELWHHSIDGHEGSTLMDWPVTGDYCRKLAAAFDIPIYYSWREGGFERELLRQNALTAPTVFEQPDGTVGRSGGERGKLNTRRRFPQVSADLQLRWCSSALKIDCADIALRNQDRFRNSRTLVLTGERAEESPGRARYATFEPHRADLRGGGARRHIDHWRPVHDWTTAQVWDLIRRYRVNPHPAYRLGLGRVSCMLCIFSSAAQLCTIRAIAPVHFAAVATLEIEFGVTIKRNRSMVELADLGKPYASVTPELAALALSTTFDEPIFVDDWQMPAGAFGESCGPT